MKIKAKGGRTITTSPINPPTSNHAPLNLFSPNTILLISEASPSYTTVYRGTVLSATYNDIDPYEKGVPIWYAEFLLFNQTPLSFAPFTILSFTLLSWTKNPDVEPLPDFSNVYVAPFVLNLKIFIKLTLFLKLAQLLARSNGARTNPK